MRRSFLFLCLLCIVTFTFTLCIPSRAFVAATVEPVVIENKGESQFTLSMRLNKYAQIDGAYSITNKLVLKTSAAGFYQFGNVMGALLYNTSYKSMGFYAGPLFNYQRNKIALNASDLSGTLFFYYGYNCEYFSPGTLIGFSLKRKEYRKYHLLIKPQYNVVRKYKYYNLDSDRYQSTDNEYLEYNIPNFLSLEISAAYLIKMRKHNFLKLQIGATFLQKTLIHKYVFDPFNTPYSGSGGTLRTVSKQTAHPVSWPKNFSIG